MNTSDTIVSPCIIRTKPLFLCIFEMQMNTSNIREYVYIKYKLYQPIQEHMYASNTDSILHFFLAFLSLFYSPLSPPPPSISLLLHLFSLAPFAPHPIPLPFSLTSLFVFYISLYDTP